MPPDRISVTISDADRAELARLLKNLQGMKEAPLTRILLHYGIRNASKAVAEMLEESGDGDGREA
jgi:NAD-dependent DNA ligase